MREGFINNYYVVLVRDGTAVYSHKEHDMTVCNTDRFFGEVSTIEELRGIWSGGTPDQMLRTNPRSGSKWLSKFSKSN